MGNNITKPDHYCEGRKYEPKDVIRDWGLNFNLGSAVKYISRAGRKGDKLEDLRKARQFLEFEIETVEKANEQGRPEKLLESRVNGVLDGTLHIALFTEPYQKEIINRIVERINNGELDCFDISGDLYHGYQEIRDALIIQVLRNAGNDTFISKTYAHQVIKGIITFDSIPDEYKSGVIDKMVREVLDNQCDIDQDIPSDELRAVVIDRIVERIYNDELGAIDIPTDLFCGYRDIRDALTRQASRKVREKQKSDIGMTCKDAAEIGDAIAKGFKDGIKEAQKTRFVDLNTGKDIWLKQEESDTFTFSFEIKEETEQEDTI